MPRKNKRNTPKTNKISNRDFYRRGVIPRKPKKGNRRNNIRGRKGTT